MSTTQKDDDLLILSEDATTLDFGVPDELEKKSENNDDFSFTIEEENQIPEDKNFDNELKAQTEDSLSDLMSDLTPKENQNTSEIKKEEFIEEKNLDLGGFDFEQPASNINKNTENVSLAENNYFISNDNGDNNKNIGDMSEILERTISEFTEREELISKDVSEREKHISDLEKELNTEKEILSDLESEKSAIEKNRKSLEKMKTDFENRDEEKNTITKKTSQK